MKDICFSCSKILRLLILAFILPLVSSCGGGSSNSAGSTEQVSKPTTGVAQKGPLVIGSEVNVARLDSSGVELGETATIKITSRNGGFVFKSPDNWPAGTDSLYKFSTSGQFFNEATGASTPSSISLTTITDNLNNHSINVFTHWLALRIDVLLKQGTKADTALEQSNNELKALFGATHSNQLDFTNSTSELTSENALLLLVSGALLDVANNYNTSAENIVVQISLDFEDDGKLTAEGDVWLDRMQASIRDNPASHLNHYAKNLKTGLNLKTVAGKDLPALVNLASRPVAILPEVVYAAPGETITLNGSDSHDSGNIINFTWFRVDQQTQYAVPVSDRFSASPKITVPNQESILLFALIVTDADKLIDTGVIKVLVREPPPENNSPVAESQIDDQTVITNEDTPVNITLKGSDPDGDSINFVISTPLLLPNGLLEGTAPNLEYTPTANFNGTDHFTFLVDDGSLTSEIARVNIIVLPVNDPPIADDKTVVTDEDTPVAINFSGSDIENDPLTFRLGPNSPNSGSLSGTPPNVVYSPGSNFFGNDSFDYIANDGVDDSLPATVNIQVLPVDDNTRPVANAGDDIPESFSGDPLQLDGSGSDLEDGTNVTYQWSAPAGIVLSETDIPNPTFTAPNVTSQQTFSISLTVRDTELLASLPNEMQVTVNPVVVNVPPTAQDLTLDLDPFKPLTIQLQGDDPDGTILIYSIVDEPSNGSLDQTNLATGEVEYSPDSLVGSTSPAADNFTYQVEDEDGVLSNIATVNLLIPPVAIATFNVQIPNTNIFNSGTTVDLVGGESFDPDGIIETYLWKQTGGPAVNLDPDENATNPTFTAPVVTASTAPMVLTFELIVTDNDGAMDSDEVSITINGKPTADDQGVSIDPTAFSVNITLTGSDPEGSLLTYKILSPGPSPGMISGITYGVPFTNPNIVYETIYTPENDSFQFTVIDEHGFESEPATVNIIVDNNNAPIAHSRTGDLQVILELATSNSITFNLSGSDPDGDEFIFELVEANPPSGTNFTLGAFFSDDGEVTYTVLDYLGAFEFTFRVRDQHGLPSADATVRIITIPFSSL